VLECVVNVSEGRRQDVIDALARAAGGALLDVHADEHHHRSVLTLAGPDVERASRAVTREGVTRIDVTRHRGAHPRFGAVDVVPFVPLLDEPMTLAIAARDEFARWAAAELAVPCFLYGPERSLPEVRRHAFGTLAPDVGPDAPHPAAGAIAVGARAVLVAYNLWLADDVDVVVARDVARELRGPAVRALGFDLGGCAQVSCNLVDPVTFGPAEAYDAVASRAAVARAELVGLVPAAVLARTPAHRWAELGLDSSRTIEARLEEAGLTGRGERRGH
jgi:glutamate formiminotransferase